MNSGYAALTRALAEATLDPGKEQPALVQIAAPPQGHAKQRLAIYTEGYRLRLCGAVASDFPALSHHLGTEVLTAHILDYIEATPSRHYSLDYYPHGFPAFLARRDPGSFAASLAALEGAIAEVFLMPDSPALTPDGLQDPAKAMLCLRRASRLLALEWPADLYLTAQRGGAAAEVPEKRSAHYLIHRHHNEVRRTALTPFQHRVLEAMDGSRMLESILAGLTGTRASDAGDLQALFTFALRDGVFAAQK